MRTNQLHISKTINYFIFILIIIGCSNQEATINSLDKGIYASKKQSSLKSLYFSFIHDSRFTIGDTLTIYDSVNFAYRSCGNYGFGNYEIKNDSLYLNYDSSAAYSDSIMFDTDYTHTLYIENESTLIRELKVYFTKESMREKEEGQNAVTKLHYIGDTHSRLE